jgi:hypothetical protein
MKGSTGNDCRPQAGMYSVLEHIERFGTVLIDRQTKSKLGMMFGRVEALWYGHPQQFRNGLMSDQKFIP